ncbi:MAG TPA: DUF1294 domain-containing protein [Vicinamibacterales bacterium]|nr:DUF1294 domain-containing protein [Vicinamibacterales bacterium]
MVALAVYGVMSAVAFFLYWSDKRRAGRRGEWRTSEAMLHGVELLGGWPGALIAQRAFRHKLQKTSYMIVFWAIVALHAAGWLWWSGAIHAQTPQKHTVERQAAAAAA